MRAESVPAPQLNAQQLAEAKANPKIAAVEPDSRVSVHQSAVFTQLDAPYQLARLDAAKLPYGSDYVYSQDGSGINIYVLDTVSPARPQPPLKARSGGCAAAGGACQP